MSSKRRRKSRRRGLALPLVAFGAVLLVVAAALFAIGRRGSASPAVSAGGSSHIAVDPATIDYGYVKLGTNETFKIKVTNTGTGVLQFADAPYVEVLEGC